MKSGIVCFGELFWDNLSTEDIPWGGSYEFCYSSLQTGFNPTMISRTANNDD